MQKRKGNVEALRIALESYTEASLWIASAKAAGIGEHEEFAPFEIEKTRERLAKIRNFVISLPNCKEKLLLYYRYIRGLSMERTAELLGVSLRSSYRIRLRALEFAAARFEDEAAS